MFARIKGIFYFCGSKTGSSNLVECLLDASRRGRREAEGAREI